MIQNVLIIEKNGFLKQVLKSVIASKYKVFAKENCFDALKDLKRNKIDLIIIDINEIDSENIDFLNHIKTSIFFKRIPVIVLLENKTKELKGVCRHFGVSMFFTKPFDPVILLNRVEEIMEGKATFYIHSESEKVS